MMPIISKKILAPMLVFALALMMATQTKPFVTKAAITESKVVASDGAQDDYFGGDVAIDGDYAIVGARQDDVGANANQGSAYIFYNDPVLGWTQQDQLNNTGGAAGDTFGNAVAISGDYAFIGAMSWPANNRMGIVYVFKRSGTSWSQQAQLTASDGQNNDYFGSSVFVSRDYVAVGAMSDDSSRGSAYVFVKPGAEWNNMTQTAKLTASDGVAGDKLGSSISAHGDYIIVGADYDDTDNGSAYVFVKPGIGWGNMTQTAKLTADDYTTNDYFGRSVSINDSFATVGAYKGSIYMFNKPPTGWVDMTQTTKITVGGVNIGMAHSILNNDYIIAGARYDSSLGAAYVFYRNQGGADNWGQFTKITASDGLSNDNFGSFVSFSDNFAIIGAEYADVTFTDRGSAYFYTGFLPPNTPPDFTATDFTGTTATLNWTDVADETGYNIYHANDTTQGVADITGIIADKTFEDITTVNIPAFSDTNPNYFWLTAENANGESDPATICLRYSSIDGKLLACDADASDNFGLRVSIDGDYAIVGAPNNDDNGSGSGSAYIFKRNGTTWSEIKKLTASDADASDGFGESVSISGDYAIVGAGSNQDVGVQTGSAYIFDKNEGGPDNWGEVQKLLASDASTYDQFGTSVAIDSDYAIVGAQRDGSFRGSAYIFERSGGVWPTNETKKILASDGASNDYFGISVAISGNTAIVGASRNHEPTNDEGSAYIFERSGGVWPTNENIKVTAGDKATFDEFGTSVAIDGDYAVVGAHYNDDTENDSGSAYILHRDQGGPDQWGEVTKITGSNPWAGAFFGSFVSIDGDFVIAGAVGDDENGNGAGAAYLFDRNEGGVDSWGEVQKILASDGQDNDTFGIVSISGNYIISGAYWDDDGGNDAGAAYIFTGFAEVCGNGTREGTEQCDDGGTANGDGCSDICELEDPTFYVDYVDGQDTDGTDNDECTDTTPCDTVESAATSAVFNLVIAADPTADITFNVRGTLSANEQFPGTGNFGSVLIQPWGDVRPLVEGNFYIGEEDVIVDGFELDGSSAGPFDPWINGAMQATGVRNGVIRNNYIHDFSTLNGIQINGEYDLQIYNNYIYNNGGVGVNLSGSTNTLVYNNIISNNRDPNPTNSCGGLYTGGAQGAVFMNNTSYNNCTSAHNGSVYGDVEVGGGSNNPTIKQNLVYNDLGGETYLFKANEGISTINGTATGFALMTGQTAADFGSGNNFIAATDPFTDVASVIDWISAGIGFVLSGSEHTNYQIAEASLDGSTSPADFAGNPRPDAPGSDAEAGALEVMCGNGLITGLEQCDDGNFVNGDGCSDSCKIEDGPIFFVDYVDGQDTDGTDNDECGELNPCRNISDVFNAQVFYNVVEDTTARDITIKVRGLNGTAEFLWISDPTITPTFGTTYLIQPWGAGMPETIGFYKAGSDTRIQNVTIEGFEVRDANAFGMGFENAQNFTIRNNYVHDNRGIGIRISGDQNKVQNNIVVDNRYQTSSCGGIAIFDLGISGDTFTGNQIVNNTLYNNCDMTTAFFADISVPDTNSNTVENTYVFQNIVYNDLGGRTFYYEVNGERINNEPAVGILENQVAADHIDADNLFGGNFIETSTNPFVNPTGATDWASAGTGFALNTSEYTNYQIVPTTAWHYLMAIIPDNDYLGNTRPTGYMESGAIEYAGLVCGDGVVEENEMCDDGDTDDGDGCSSLCHDEEINFYVDLNSGATGSNDLDCSKSVPCLHISDVARNCPDFRYAAYITNSNVNINVRGNAPFDMLWPHGCKDNPATVTLRSEPGYNAHLESLSVMCMKNLIIENMEFSAGGGPYISNTYDSIVRNNYMHDAPGGIGVYTIVDVNNIDIYNNYIHDMGTGISFGDGTNQNAYNNLLVSNNDGGFCGALKIITTDSSSFINNTLIDNCPDGAPAGADIIASGIGEATIKQNLIYNSLPSGNIMYFNQVGGTINGAPLNGEYIDGAALALIGGNNILETTTDPFVDITGGATYADAGVDFALSTAEYVNYGIAIIDLDPLTSNRDFTNYQRPTGDMCEVGALEYHESTGGGGGDDDTPCSPSPTKLNIRDTFIGQLDGDPIVTLRWREEGLQELNAGQKIQILFDYLDASPTVGSNDVKLKNIFTQHIYTELEKSANDICDDSEADSILSLIKSMASDPEVSGLIVEFINNLLALENTLVATGEAVTTPFTNFYNQQYGGGTGSGTLKVAREVSESGTFVADMMTDDLGPTAKSWTDSDIPESEIQKQYRYQLITESCDETKYGDKTIVIIDPVVPPGTNVDVTLDLTIIVKEAYDMLIMDKFRKLFIADEGQFIHDVACEEVSAEFFERRNSELALDYLIACFGEDDEKLIGAIMERESFIIPLLVEMIKNEIQQGDIESKVIGIIDEIKGDIALEAGTRSDVRELGINVGGFVNETDIANLDEADENLMKLIGEDYFSGVSHAADLVIEKYDSDNNLLETFSTRTDIFGRTKMNVGNFVAGDDYKLEIKLANERFVLPKIANIQINNATEEIRPFGTIYTADVNLRFDKPFRFGDFNEDGQINLSDLAAWGELLMGQIPGESNGYELWELWNFANLDGIQGIDLFDAITLQQNWGGLKEFSIEESEISLLELLELFGIRVTTRPDLELVVKVATWVNYLGSECQ